MLHKNTLLKTILLFLMQATVWSNAFCTGMEIGYSEIQVKEKRVHGIPKGSSIQATLDGHTLSVVFLENLGQVYVEVEEVYGGEAQAQSTPTPDGIDFYIPYAGSYIVTFTLPNGDEYYGEFEVSD